MCTKFCSIIAVITIVIGGVMIAYLVPPNIMSYSEIEKCPYCYGEVLCGAFRKNEITTNTMKLYFITSFFKKNVFHAEYNNMDVIIKKLGSTDELQVFDKRLCNENDLEAHCDVGHIDDRHNYTEKVIALMNDDNISMFKPFKVCSAATVQLLFEHFLKMKVPSIKDDEYLKNVWTILKINVEPLILQLLHPEKNWPLPKYYGSCGRLAVMDHRGTHLLRKTDSPWMDRAYLALQLLYGAKNFTFDHPQFRFYLTDVSPDNVAVDDALKLTFVDLENLVVVHDIKNGSSFHTSEVIHDLHGFAYSQEDLCKHNLSDHNYYSVCKLLLSRNAPYPMMKNGLLHSPPVDIVYHYQELFDLIEDCSDAKNVTNRFDTGQKIMDILNEILNNKENEAKLSHSPS